MKSVELFWKNFKKQNFKRNGDNDEINLQKLIIKLFNLFKNFENITFDIPLDEGFINDFAEKG